MHRALVAVLATLLLTLAIPAAPVLAASDAKVVVVVGPSGGSTAHYKQDARQIVEEARRWSSNVVKVFTPDATWSRVKAAAQGASVFVYLGHGNGWPSKYGPFQTLTKNGLGLDPSSGADSTRTVYYGEEYVRKEIRFAPNAVVLLYHLCYASGNTEPGLPVGSFTDSRERVDNYGAGFIGAGARAVIAEGHPAHPVTDGIRQLFTTSRTLAQVFRAAPTFHGNVLGPYPSQRTPGLAYLLDPDTKEPSGFYRSIVGDLSLTAKQVTGPATRRTDGHPADFVVPGAAEVVAPAGAGLFAHAGNAADPARTASTTLPAGTRLRVTSEAASAADGTRILGVSVLGGSDAGFVRAPLLAPRDSAAVEAWSLDRSASWLSPNGDGTADALVVTARFSEAATAVFTVRNASGTKVRTLSQTTDLARFEWDLHTSSDARIPDGTYTWALKAADRWDNPAFTASGEFTVDGTAPVTKAVAEGTAGANGWLVSPATVTLTSRDALSGVQSIGWRVDGGRVSAYDGPAVITANGTVTFEYRAVDRAGIREAWRSLTLRIDTRAPVVALPMAGKAGDAPGTWRGPVTVTPSVKDASSGVATKRFSVDGAGSSALGSDPITVTGDGPHTITVSATDGAGNRSSITERFTIDTVPPSLELPAVGDTVPTVTPNGDRVTEEVGIAFTASEPGTVTAVIAAADGTPVRTLRTTTVAGENRLAWNGRGTGGAAAPDGRYTITLTPRDLAGNAGKAATLEVDVYAALGGLVRSPGLFHPQDGDTLARKTVASWTLASPATVSIRVLGPDGAVVRTGPVDRAYPAGAARWAWNGRDDAGAFVAPGVYRISVTATNGAQVATQAADVRAAAFRVTTSVDAAVRGRSLVVKAVSAEPLAGAPKVVVRQPGLAAWSVAMTRSGGAWTATVTPKKAGTAGTMTLVVKATDTAGGTNAATLRLALQ